ncbi:MAG: hypothetical protein RIC94_01880 [Phycisphaerales bacterium]
MLGVGVLGGRSGVVAPRGAASDRMPTTRADRRLPIGRGLVARDQRFNRLGPRRRRLEAPRPPRDWTLASLDWMLRTLD